MFEALPERISKKEKYFAIALFHELFKSGVKAEDFSLFIFHILKGLANFNSPKFKQKKENTTFVLF